MATIIEDKKRRRLPQHSSSFSSVFIKNNVLTPQAFTKLLGLDEAPTGLICCFNKSIWEYEYNKVINQM